MRSSATLPPCHHSADRDDVSGGQSGVGEAALSGEIPNSPAYPSGKDDPFPGHFHGCHFVSEKHRWPGELRSIKSGCSTSRVCGGRSAQRWLGACGQGQPWLFCLWGTSASESVSARSRVPFATVAAAEFNDHSRSLSLPRHPLRLLWTQPIVDSALPRLVSAAGATGLLTLILQHLPVRCYTWCCNAKYH